MAVALAVGALAAPVPAATTGTVETRAIAESPKLAGESALWTQPRRDWGLELWSASPGGDPVRVQHFPVSDPAGSAGQLIGDLAASPSVALLTLVGVDYVGNRGFDTSFTDQYVGPVGAPLERAARCEGEGHGGIRSADVWGEAYAYRACDDGYGHVEIRDSGAAPLSPSRSVGVGGFGVRIAGRYVAWLERYYRRYVDTDATVVVYDRVADAEVYRIPSGFGNIQNLDVQEDGKVAIAFDPLQTEQFDYGVGWASAEEPWMHRLSLPARRFYDIRIADDRIAFQGGDGTWVRDADVGVADLAGTVRWLARGTDALLFDESFDYDAERVLWRELGCEERRLVIAAADAPEPVVPRARNCRLRLLARPVVRGGVASFRFGCGALEGPCNFQVSLRMTDRAGTPAGRVEYRSDPVRVTLTRPALRAFRARGSLRVRATVALSDRRSRYQVRRATIRLRPK